MNLNKEKIKNLILEIMAKAIDKTNNSESDVFQMTNKAISL